VANRAEYEMSMPYAHAKSLVPAMTVTPIMVPVAPVMPIAPLLHIDQRQRRRRVQARIAHVGLGGHGRQ